MADDDKAVTIRLPQWLYRAVILALLAGTWGLVKYAWSELQGNIDGKVSQAEYNEWRKSVDKQLESLWRRR